MNVERDILAAACDSREAYNRILAHLGTDDLTESGRMVWDVIDAYYCRDTSIQYVQIDTLDEQVRSSVTNPKHKETLSTIVQGVRDRDVSGLNVVSALVDVKKEVAGSKLAQAILSGGDTTELMAAYQELDSMEDLGEAKESEKPVFGWNPTDESAEEAGALIGIAPSSLNTRLGGGCMRGHHIIVFARPEMGKTSFLANLTAGFLQQDLKVLYVGNEDPITDIRTKFLSRVIGWTKDDINEDKPGAYSVALETTNWSNLGTTQLAPGTPMEIEDLVKEHRPDVLLVDQLRNLVVRTNKSDGVVQHLEAAAKAVRQIGIRNKCLVISVTQAGDSASGKAILDMSDVDSSKTGIPAQADVMIGIGASSEDEAASRRVLSLPKNKRTGRHEFFPVGADFTTSTFKSIG